MVLCALMGCTLAFMICLVGIKGENLVQSKIRWNDKQPLSLLGLASNLPVCTELFFCSESERVFFGILHFANLESPFLIDNLSVF